MLAGVIYGRSHFRAFGRDMILVHLVGVKAVFWVLLAQTTRIAQESTGNCGLVIAERVERNSFIICNMFTLNY